MGKRKDATYYVLSKLKDADFGITDFQVDNLILLDDRKKTNLHINLLHEGSKTIILIGRKEKHLELLQDRIGNSYKIFNIKKANHKKSWIEQKDLIVASLNESEYVSAIVSEAAQPAIRGGYKKSTEDLALELSEKKLLIDAPPIEKPEKINENEPSHPYNLNTDLIGKTPNWIMRSGMSIIAFAVILFLIFSYFIKYPDKITAQGYVYNETPPVEHIFQVDGVVEEVFVEDGQIVKKDAPLIYIKNDMKKVDFQTLSAFLARIDQAESVQEVCNLIFPKELQLGEFSEMFSELEILVAKLKQSFLERETQAKINALKREISKTSDLSKLIKGDKQLLNQELALSEKNLTRYKSLNKDGAVSDLETENEFKSNLQLLKQLNNVDKGIINNQINEGQMLLEIIQLQESRQTSIRSQFFTVREQNDEIRNALVIWESKYFLKAEIDGKVKFGPRIHKSFTCNSENLALTISPLEQKESYVNLEIPSAGVGKIKQGDKVILKFAAYPYKEFGIVTSHVDLISDFPTFQDGIYLYQVQIPLNDKSITNTGFTIPMAPFSELTAEIITKDYSILKRIAQKASPIIK